MLNTDIDNNQEINKTSDLQIKSTQGPIVKIQNIKYKGLKGIT
jgi:hypothetical protein